MTRTTRTERSASSPGAAQRLLPARLGPLDVLVLSLWCGLAAGLLEVAARVLCSCIGLYPLYTMSRHFVWLVPLAESAPVFRDRSAVGGGNEALASARRVAQPTHSLRLCRPADAHGRRSPDLYGGLVDLLPGDCVASGSHARAA